MAFGKTLVDGSVYLEPQAVASMITQIRHFLDENASLIQSPRSINAF